MSTKIMMGIFLTLVLGAICFAPVLIAQDLDGPLDGTDDLGGEEEVEADYTLWGLIRASGFIGMIIILLSVVSMALAIEHFVTLQRDKLIPPDLLQDIEDLFEDENYEDVIETCASEPGFLTNVIGAALPRVESGFDSMMEAIHSIGEEETVKLQQKISFLQLIAAIAPMLGLLGTVWGMIVAFGRIANLQGSPKPQELAEGIYQALVTTCLGLVVAIISMCCYFFYRNKVVRISMEITGVAEELLDRFRERA